MLFLLLITSLAVLVAAWLALPWLNAARTEKVERDLNRGAAPSRDPHPAKALAFEQARQSEYLEAHAGFRSMVGTEHYRGLNPSCRDLVDTYVALPDEPANAATDQASVRSRASDIQRRFDAECVDAAAAAPAPPSTGAQSVGSSELANVLLSDNAQYRALGPVCRGHVDTVRKMIVKPHITPADEERMSEIERLFEANCVDRQARADAYAEAACAQKREAAARHRAAYAQNQGKPGTSDTPVRDLEVLEADIAANCR